MSEQRPITPMSIIARNLEELHRRATAGSAPFEDPRFVETLAATARMATGLDAYLSASSTPESGVLADLVRDTAARDWTRLYAAGETAIPLEREMVSGHVEGQFLKLLIHAMRATRVLEIGLFTGYSALAMAEALPSDGRLIACEIDAYAAGVARHWFDRSPHGGKIRIELGPAIDSLERLRAAGETFDLVFIDADKAQYAAYLEIVVGGGLLADAGLVCVDNTLLQGEPYLAGPQTENGRAIAEFNRFLAADPRVEQVMLPIRDGLTLVRRASP